MKNLYFEKKFINAINKINNNSIKEKIKKQIVKISINPKIEKPLRHGRKNTREVYVKPYHISYKLIKEKIVFLDFYHKDNQ